MPKSTTNRTPRNLPNATAKPVSVVPDTDTAIATITSAVTSAFEDLRKPKAAVDVAKGDLEKAQEGELSVKERLVVRLATASITGMWSVDHIADAVGKAVEAWATNHKASSMSQFGTELRRAMHPLAREHVESALTTAHDAFEQEAADAEAAIAADPKAKPERPLKSAFSRAYQAAVSSKGMLQAYIDGMPEAVDPHMLAEARSFETRTDPNKAAKRFDKIVDQIKDLYDEFPARELQTILSFAGKINRKSLDAARRKASATTQRTASPRPAPVSDVEDAEAAADSVMPQE